MKHALVLFAGPHDGLDMPGLVYIMGGLVALFFFVVFLIWFFFLRPTDEPKPPWDKYRD